MSKSSFTVVSPSVSLKRTNDAFAKHILSKREHKVFLIDLLNAVIFDVANSVKMIHKERSKIDPPFYKTGGSFDNQGDFCGYFSFVSTRKIYKSNST